MPFYEFFLTQVGAPLARGALVIDAADTMVAMPLQKSKKLLFIKTEKTYVNSVNCALSYMINSIQSLSDVHITIYATADTMVDLMDKKIYRRKKGATQQTTHKTSMAHSP